MITLILLLPPVLIGGKKTASLMDERSLITPAELEQLGVLKLGKCDVFKFHRFLCDTRLSADKINIYRGPLKTNFKKLRMA